MEFGFAPDTSVMSDVRPGLSYDFGNFKLTASVAMGQYFQPIVLCTGVLASQRSLTQVCFELPRLVASREQLAAMLVYYLDNAARGNLFHPMKHVAWLDEGRANRDLLPWELDKAAYETRPRCMVRRDWLRLALKNLSMIFADTDDTATVEFTFDGTVLTIRCCDQALPMPATGKAWSAHFNIPAGNLRQLPKRLMRDELEISVNHGRLYVDRVSYGGVKEKQP